MSLGLLRGLGLAVLIPAGGLPASLTVERKGASRSATVTIAPGEGGAAERAGRQGS